MKTILAGIIALTTVTSAFAVDGPAAPALQEVLKRPQPGLIIFRPTSLAPGQTLNLTHIRMGDGSVRPGSAVQLIVYSSEANEQGQHPVLFQDFHFLSKEGSPVLEFEKFVSPTPPQGRTRNGIIAILIGLLQPSPNAPFRPGNLPPQDIVSAEITDGTSIGLLLPAVQKVRSAAAR